MMEKTINSQLIFFSFWIVETKINQGVSCSKKKPKICFSLKIFKHFRNLKEIKGLSKWQDLSTKILGIDPTANAKEIVTVFVSKAL